MKLVQLNIWNGKLEFQLFDFMKKIQADIVCMQEVNDLPGSSGALFASLDEIKQAGSFEHKFMAPVYTFQFHERTNAFGNAILSRYPLRDTDTQFVAGAYQTDFDEETNDFDVRNFQHAVIKVGSQNVHIINFHGSFVPGSKAGNAHTLQQAQRIITYTQSFADDPIIITGDFNVAPTSDTIGLMDKHFRNLSVEHAVASTYSPVLHVFNEVCDYIFVNQYVTVADFSVSDEVVSDHKALIMEFDV